MNDDIEEQARALMRALGATLGLALEPDEEAACGLRIEGQLDLALRFEPDRQTLLAHAEVGELSAGDAALRMRQLLQANQPWEGGADATWSLVGEHILLSRRFPLAGLDAAGLADELAVFAERALAEQGHLRDDPAPAGDRPPPGSFIA